MRDFLKLAVAASLVVLTACSPSTKTETKVPEPAAPSTAVAGQKFQHDGIEFSYDVQGSGEPLLLIHGNGGSSRDFQAQIAYFRKSYRVIAHG